MNDPERQSEVTDLVEAHYAELYRYAYRLTGSQSDAEDLAQQAFLAALQKLGQLREKDRARPWLFAIVRNGFLKLRRDQSNHRNVSLEDSGEPSDVLSEVPELTGEELSTVLDELPEEFRVPLVLFYFEEMSYRDIASVLELPEGTVMSRLSRAKSHLRQRLGERQPTASAK